MRSAATYKDWLPDPDEAPTSPLGDWLEIKFQPPHDDLVIDGELLAIQDGNVYVLRGNAARAGVLLFLIAPSIQKLMYRGEVRTKSSIATTVASE